jgi:hypothetical protein
MQQYFLCGCVDNALNDMPQLAQVIVRSTGFLSICGKVGKAGG